MIVSVSRATSYAGISTETARLTPSFFASSFLAPTVSVGLTFSFRRTLQRLAGSRFLRAKEPGLIHTTLILSVKTEAEQRQTERTVVGQKPRRCAPQPEALSHAGQ